MKSEKQDSGLTSLLTEASEKPQKKAAKKNIFLTDYEKSIQKNASVLS